LVAAAKFLVAATKILFVVPNFVAVTRPFFSWNLADCLLFGYFIKHGKKQDFDEKMNQISNCMKVKRSKETLLFLIQIP